VFSDDGKVVADQGANREAIVRTLQFFTDVFGSGCVPSDSPSWSDGDNNASFHSKSIVMTPNPSMSIPAHQFFNNPDNYFNQSATIEWPDGPDGRKPTYPVAVKSVLIPKDSTNRDVPLAKDFIKFVLEPNRLGEYIKSANGRWFPAFKDVAADPFFARGQAGKGGAVDPHLPIATRIYLERTTRVFAHYKNPATSRIYAENVWGKAMSRTNADRWPAAKAADEAIGRIKTIVAQWR
jgi:multiple sugar transport system substrate-binding protein